MGRMLYFLPGYQGAVVTYEQLERHGLAYAFPRRPGPETVLAEGPSGAGALVAMPGPGPLRYCPAEQSWAPLVRDDASIASGATPWAGLWTDPALRPGPEDLMRPHRIEGYPVVLADAAEWQIPVVRRRPYTGPEELGLPVVIGIDRDGRAVCDIQAEYQSLYVAAEAMRMDLFAEAPRAAPPEELLALAGLALSAQYRVGRVEVGLLRLIDSANVRDVVDALLDGPNLREFIQEYRKKKSVASAHGVIS